MSSGLLICSGNQQLSTIRSAFCAFQILGLEAAFFASALINKPRFMFTRYQQYREREQNACMNARGLRGGAAKIQIT